MTDVLTAVRERRSVRAYEKRPIAPDVIGQLKEAMLRSPSSRGVRPWRFVFVTDHEKLTELSRAKPQYAGFLSDAALGVAVCADEDASDAWVEDCSIAATILQLTAASFGLGSCWIQIRMRPHDDGSSAEEYVAAALGLPGHTRVACIVSLGYPAETKPTLDSERLKWDAVTDA